MSWAPRTRLVPYRPEYRAGREPFAHHFDADSIRRQASMARFFELVDLLGTAEKAFAAHQKEIQEAKR